MRPILLIMWTAFQSFILRDNNNNDNNNNNNNNNNNLMTYSACVTWKYAHTRITLK